ncbi:U2 small nuclear ribonucleoprotein auxiliary factor 35 kDa subunit-related protein 2 [Sipha flava]|jgi:hypothetical protein|uniref:U2 small nuclear ribonucleoprotein auxiliary factor 35 kDa subunit-related protein 2 n=1 Tax=Sipha flava TaxID=143950 RepID=A0A8B8GAH6_9HEMI|nr:U2 small nuclear ribonucleoprotein auxiliary factor 35 kDa subunit-related protein 2 [Sipha flava]
MRNHKILRNKWKKIRRKRLRQKKASEREELYVKQEQNLLNSPTYQKWLKSHEEIEEFEQKENERNALVLYNEWIEREYAATREWELLQNKLNKIKQDKARKDLLIKLEWEKEQKKIKEIEENKKKEMQLQEEINAKFIEKIEMYINGIGPLPESLNVSTNTRPDQPLCPFFSKVAACRFRDNCSRNHVRPGISNTLLIPGFYKNFELNMRYEREFDIDISLECDEKEAYEKFYDFFEDILVELKNYGQIIELNVCRNQEIHLLGNVYVQYRSRRHSLKAYRNLCGRYYGGRKITAEFCNIPSWSEAVCGLYFKNMCPKGKNCNYLHLYKNPGGRYQSKPQRNRNDSSQCYRENKNFCKLKQEHEENSEINNKRNSSKREKRLKNEKSSTLKWDNTPDRKNKNSVSYNWSSDDD